MKKPEYTDIHAHIIPAVDDGSESMEESLAMLKRAYEQGIRRIIATPHFMPEADNREQIIKAFNKLKAEMTQNQPICEMQLDLGNELYYCAETVNDLKAGRANTLCGTKYVLVEFSVRAAYQSLYKGLKELIEAGYRPILAHAERYACLFKNESRNRELIRLGVYIQVNADSFLGGIFDSLSSWCLKLFKGGMIHFIASDCHDEKDRVPVMDTAVKWLIKKTDEASVRRITEDNIRKLFNNQYI